MQVQYLQMPNYFQGAVDQQERDEFNEVGKQITEAYSSGDIDKANLLTDQLLDRAIFNQSLSTHAVTDNDIYGTLNQFEKLNELMNSQVGPALNIATDFGAQKPMVPQSLTDLSIQCIDIVEEILNTSTLKVFVYGGQVDWLVSVHETFLWVKDLNWSGKNNFAKAMRKTIVVNGVHEGYEKVTERLGFFWINRAGHQVSYVLRIYRFEIIYCNYCSYLEITRMP